MQYQKMEVFMKTIYALIKSEEQAQKIIDQMTSAGITSNDISILLPDHKNSWSKEIKASDDKLTYYSWKDDKGNWSKNVPSTLGIEGNTKAPEGGVIGATTGGLLGGTIGLLAGIGALAIPGLGAFIAAGPIIAALSGSAIGGSLGLLIGSLVAAGIPEYEAKELEAGLKEGKIMISIQAKNDNQAHQVKDILEKSGATKIYSTSMASSY